MEACIFMKLQDTQVKYFCTSLYAGVHPFANMKRGHQERYYIALAYFVNTVAKTNPFFKARLNRYRAWLVENEARLGTYKNPVKNIVKGGVFGWNSKARYVLLCDIAIIVLENKAIDKACAEMKLFLGKRSSGKLESFKELLLNDNAVHSPYEATKKLVRQFHGNRQFIKLPEKRFLVTANVSAGKSTLINAIIGKPLVKMAQEICTSNLSYIYSKPYDDGTIFLRNTKQGEASTIASYFRTVVSPAFRMCLIDTPGVNSVVEPMHRTIAQNAIVSEDYDTLIYVLNAGKLGTDEEIKHLKFVYNNVPAEKVVFVLNQLDRFRIGEDSILGSIEGVKADLQKIGYQNPIVCPLSAYFSFLLKMKHNGIKLSKREQADFNLYKEIFSDPEYDLSKFVGKTSDKDDELTVLSCKSGLYGLEKILNGG